MGVLIDERTIWLKAQKDGECWLWTGGLNKDGYGTLNRHEGREWYAHRETYRIVNGPIPSGTEIDHLCRRPSCVNPSHLEAVSHLENVKRGKIGLKASRNLCAKGHVFSPENTYMSPSGHKNCRACGCESSARYLRRKKENA